MTNLENNTAAFIETNAIWGPTDRILIAVSGGADSAALLAILAELKEKNIISNDLICAHINHQLRAADSKKDKDFVIAEAEKLGLKIITTSINVAAFAQQNKLSIETAARNLRIEALINIAIQYDCSVIATAHHKNDNAETVIQRLARGTGFKGLCGIWPKKTFANNICFVRPLLNLTHHQILEYLKEKNLNHRTDKTNLDITYRRNFIRHRLIGALQKNCRCPIEELLYDLSCHARKYYTLIANEADKLWPKAHIQNGKKITLNCQSLTEQAEPVKIELIRKTFDRLNCRQRNITRDHFQSILKLAQNNISGKKIQLPDDCTVCYEYGQLIFCRIAEEKQTEFETKQLQLPGKTSFGPYSIKAEIIDAKDFSVEKFKTVKDRYTEAFDYDKLTLPLTVRSREAGDRFIPFGRVEQKKIGKFLTDQHIGSSIRNQTFIITDKKQIIWLYPLRISHLTRIDDTTKKILILTVTADRAFQKSLD